jgi:hypothetical protein
MAASFFVLTSYLNSLPFRVVGILLLLFFAVLFLQSGFDKVQDRKGNLDWLIGHFSKSMFKNSVPFLLAVITVMELISGFASLGTAVYLGFAELSQIWIPFAVVSFCALTLLNLFAGQRIAKDYAGAAGIVPYFIVAFLAMVFFGGLIFWEG